MRQFASRFVMMAALGGAASAVPPQNAPTASNLLTAPANPLPPGSTLLTHDTQIKLMVMREVTTKTARAGDRFPLRVNEALIVDGVTVVPAGVQGWGEVVSASESGFVGKSGKLNVQLLYLELPGGNVPIKDKVSSAGPGGAGTTVAATILFALAGAGPLGLLARGTNAKIKAGELLTAYIAEDTIINRIPLRPFDLK